MNGLSISIGLGIGSMLDDNITFYLTSIPGCIALWDPMVASSLTYGATPKSSGPGTPPAVTFSYSTVASPTAIRLEAQSTTTYRWGPDNNGTTATWAASGVTIVPGATQALGSTGVSVVFPASGIYANTQVWQTTLQSILSVNSSDILTQATASKQPLFLKLVSAGGSVVVDQYGWKTDGIDDTLICTTIDRPSPTSGTPTFYWSVFKPEQGSAGGFDCVFSANSPGSVRIQCSKRFLSFNQYMSNGGSSGNILTSNVFGRHSALFTNSTSDKLSWRNVSPVTGFGTGGFDPPAGISFGSRANDAGTFSSDSFTITGIWSNSWSSGSETLADSYSLTRGAT